jgi:transcriptional regulator with PAS, ATPase and Fis domain
VTGESGSGKEVVARLIHAGSLRCRQPLVTFNCAGFPDSLLESELFGHVRGGFTGAERDRPGVLELADGGTLFMDEVGEMSLRMQAVLLRFLETGELSRVGSDRTPTRVDVRIVAATNRDPLEAVREGRLREDLHFRLNVLHIVVPPLRDRREDIPVLVQWFARIYSQRYGAPVLDVSSDAMDLLMAYEWPGNVRQLKNVVERFVVTGASGLVTVADLPTEIVPAAGPAPVLKVARSKVDELSDRLVEQAGSFWSVVYEPFMARDLTRDEARGVIMKAWEQAEGNFSQLCNFFQIAEGDTKRFLDFVRKHGVVSPRTFPRLPKPAGGQVSVR